MTFYTNHEMLKTIEFERDRDTEKRRRARDARLSAWNQGARGRFGNWLETRLRPAGRTQPPGRADHAVG